MEKAFQGVGNLTQLKRVEFKFTHVFLSAVRIHVVSDPYLSPNLGENVTFESNWLTKKSVHKLCSVFKGMYRKLDFHDGEEPVSK